MNFLFGLIVGLIIGWVIEWVIDLLFWRRKDDSQLQEKLAAAEADARQLRAKVAEQEQELQRLATVEADARVCRTQLADAEETIDHLRAELNKLAGQVSEQHDHLPRVKGIGVIFAKRLNEAGIHTFAELAQQSPERIREIIQPEEWQKIDAESWIAQAKAFAKESERTSKGA